MSRSVKKTRPRKAVQRTQQAGPIDAFIGARIKARRKERNLTQRDIAAAMGLTFQQVQKYETGANRVSAAALFDLARILDVEVTDLLPTSSETLEREGPSSDELGALIAAFSKLRKPDARRVVLAVANTLAKLD